MRVWVEPVAFEWDKGNLDKNLILHQVSNQEAEEVFFDELSIVFSDVKHSSSERRFMIWGATKKDRKLAVVFTLRNDKVRVISARDMHRKERSYYEKIKENPKV